MVSISIQIHPDHQRRYSPELVRSRFQSLGSDPQTQQCCYCNPYTLLQLTNFNSRIRGASLNLSIKFGYKTDATWHKTYLSLETLQTTIPSLRDVRISGETSLLRISPHQALISMQDCYNFTAPKALHSAALEFGLAHDSSLWSAVSTEPWYLQTLSRHSPHHSTPGSKNRRSSFKSNYFCVNKQFKIAYEEPTEFLPPCRIQPTSDSPHRRNRSVDSDSAAQPRPLHRAPPREPPSAPRDGRSSGTSAETLRPVLMSNDYTRREWMQESWMSWWEAAGSPARRSTSPEWWCCLRGISFFRLCWN